MMLAKQYLNMAIRWTKLSLLCCGWQKIILLEKEWNNVFHVTCRSFRWNVLVCSCDPDHSSEVFEQSPKMFDLGVVCDFPNILWKLGQMPCVWQIMEQLLVSLVMTSFSSHCKVPVYKYVVFSFEHGVQKYFPCELFHVFACCNCEKVCFPLSVAVLLGSTVPFTM